MPEFFLSLLFFSLYINGIKIELKMLGKKGKYRKYIFKKIQLVLVFSPRLKNTLL